MKMSASLFLGSCIMLQTLPLRQGGVAANATDGEVLSATLYHLDQAPELLGTTRASTKSTPENTALYLKLFIHQRTEELLPLDSDSQAAEIATAVLENSQQFGLDPLFVMALIQHESRFNTGALGTHGEVGLMQMKPSTARWLIEQGDTQAFTEHGKYDDLHEALKNPAINIAFGTAYLARLRRSFKDRGPLFVSAYNMGSVNLKSKLRSGARPRVYTDHVLAEYASLQFDFANSVRGTRLDIATSVFRKFDQLN
jgi:soluble lytic murein transglycosylase